MTRRNEEFNRANLIFFFFFFGLLLFIFFFAIKLFRKTIELMAFLIQFSLLLCTCGWDFFVE
jgi:hypothetical protein